ncbi:hypothetical protein Y1Q_0013757 [Alligator mississippiensis]|uniref:Uncharacterized protein n=1 Tax=Alligator mississippiensis TaxID=8496 RepID=A0A151MM09_ALLMI|nr:hypothetical protein Y1Q_0013757 [Alligator mississippiensis]
MERARADRDAISSSISDFTSDIRGWGNAKENVIAQPGDLTLRAGKEIQSRDSGGALGRKKPWTSSAWPCLFLYLPFGSRTEIPRFGGH